MSAQCSYATQLMGFCRNHTLTYEQVSSMLSWPLFPNGLSKACGVSGFVVYAFGFNKRAFVAQRKFVVGVMAKWWIYLNYCNAVEHESLFITFWFVRALRNSMIFYGVRALLSSCLLLCFRCNFVCPQASQQFMANDHNDGGRKLTCKVSLGAMAGMTYLWLRKRQTWMPFLSYLES